MVNLFCGKYEEMWVREDFCWMFSEMENKAAVGIFFLALNNEQFLRF